MRIALLGMGRMGRIHAANLAGRPDVELLVHDPVVDRSAVPASATVVDTIGEALDDADGVVVATPTALHAEHLRMAAAVKRPLFSEKPISLDVATSLTVLDELDQAGCAVQVGFHRRFDPGYLEMKRRHDSGGLGDLYLIRTACHDHTPPPEQYLETSGSIFKDMHTHDFDAIGWLTGRRIESVFAQGSVLVDERFTRQGDVDTCVLTLRLEGGVLASVTGTRADGLGYDHRTELIGSADSVAAGHTAQTPLRPVDPGSIGPVDPYRGFAERFAPAYAAEMAAFTDLVAGRGPNRAPGLAALDALRVAEAADRSLATGRPIEVGRLN